MYRGIEKLIDLVNDLLTALQEKFNPQPELIPVPVKHNTSGHGRR